MIEANPDELLAATLNELGIDQVPIGAAWLTKNGYIVGRRFRCGCIQAVWFFDENEMKIYDQDGKLLKVCALTATTGKAA